MVKKHLISFKHAYSGVVHAISTQPNFVVHLTLSCVAIILGLFFGLTPTEWAILCLTITIGLVIELINTSIESVVDLATDKWHAHAKIAKDVSAAAMLIFALGSIGVAIILFLPKI